ncbi:hypothetical protein BDZ85DRAFT_321241 [Elsinoe ampelina]|uniref:Uncharacterized protein n=1 Tax=Elsinoe ampelina TaxID=302913 RepID=A0A6A6G4F6_9PEZI|nr:hypothetical protein BDZ85DRAFT_321241 [Elsinoe ampelina]
MRLHCTIAAAASTSASSPLSAMLQTDLTLTPDAVLATPRLYPLSPLSIAQSQSPSAVFSSFPWSKEAPYPVRHNPLTPTSDFMPDSHSALLDVQAGALGLDFSRIPACFAPPGFVPLFTATSECMDHPDIPSDFARLKNKKKSKTSDSKSSSKAKTKASEPRHAPPPPSKQPWQATETFQPRVEAQSMISESKGFGYSWNVRSSQDSSSGPGRKLSLLSSRNPKPQNLKDLPAKRPEEALSHKFLHAQHPDLTNLAELKPREPIFAQQPLSPLEPPQMPYRSESYRSDTSSQPSTPSWMDRGQRRHDEQMRYTQDRQGSQSGQQPNPQVQQYHQGYPQQYLPQQPMDPEMALFAAATSGLSPDHPQNRWNSTHANQPPLPPLPTSHQRYPSTVSQRQHSTSSSSAHSVPMISESQARPGESQDAARAYSSLTGLPKSAPDLPTTRNANTFPPGHPLARWATQSSFSSRGSSESARGSSYDMPLPQRLEQQASQASRSLDVSRQPVSPLTPESILRPVSPLSPEPPLPSQRSFPSSSPRPSLQANRSLDIPRVPSRPVSPANDEEAAWLQRNVSALTIDTGAVSPPSNVGRDIRDSMVSAISPCDVSPIGEEDFAAEGGLSPLDQDDLPDYKASQSEMQVRRQRENERRAEELRRRWEASTGR